MISCGGVSLLIGKNCWTVFGQFFVGSPRLPRLAWKQQGKLWMNGSYNHEYAGRRQ